MDDYRVGFLKGDGRCVVKPVKGSGRSMRRNTARMLVGMFMENGTSIHNKPPTTRWVIVQFCEENNIKYHINENQYGSEVVKDAGQ